MFFFAFIVHIIVWRINLPIKQARALIVIFFSTLFLSFFCLWILSLTTSFQLLKGPIEYLSIALFHISLTLAYISSYPALEAESPSIAIIKSIINAGREGLSPDILNKMTNDDLLIKPRLKDLVRDRMVILEDNRYIMTKKGKTFIQIILFYRRVLKLTTKGG